MKPLAVFLAWCVAVVPAFGAQTYTFQSSTDADMLSITDVTGLDSYPWSVAVWFNATDATNDMSVLSVTDTAGSVNWTIIQLESSNDSVQVVCRAGGAAVTGETTNFYSAGTWHVAILVATSATDRSVFLDGDTGNSGDNTTSCDPSSEDSVQLGNRNVSNGQLQGFRGELGQTCWWDVALTDAEVAQQKPSLSMPCNTIRPGSLIHWTPQWESDANEDWSTGSDWTAEGLVAAEHHPMSFDYPSANWLFPAAPAAGMLFHLHEYHGLDGLARGQ